MSWDMLIGMGKKAKRSFERFDREAEESTEETSERIREFTQSPEFRETKRFVKQSAASVVPKKELLEKDIRRLRLKQRRGAFKALRKENEFQDLGGRMLL